MAGGDESLSLALAGGSIFDEESKHPSQINCPLTSNLSGRVNLESSKSFTCIFHKDSCTPTLEAESYLQRLPIRIRAMIWKYLNNESLKNVSETCASFRREVISPLQSFRQLDLDALPTESYFPNAFIEFIRFDFGYLHTYLDTRSWYNLRLVCRELKNIVDFLDEKKLRNYRWCMLRDLMEDPLDACSSTTTIFEIHTQDMKRIMSYLSESDLQSLGMACRGFSRLVKEVETYPFKENHNIFIDWSRLNLMDLPSGVHENILNFCHPKDRANLRLVSKLMQYQVDTLAGVTVYLNDLRWNWNSCCGTLPPANSLVVTNVENINSVNYFVTDYNCTLLTKLLLDGPCLAKAMILILEHCKNLRYIGFTYALQMSAIEDELRKSFPVRRTPLELNSLKALDLKLREADMPSHNMFRVHAWSWANAFEFMRLTLFSMPRLTTFHICEESILSHNLMYEIAEKVLKFLVAHRRTLKYVSVILLGSCFRDCNCPPYSSGVSEEDLKDMQLIKFCHDCDWRISRPFANILRAQKTLHELYCFKLSDWEFYSEMIFQNRDTLKSVKIEKSMVPVIDLSVFAQCKHLEYLWISQCGASNVGRQGAYHIDPSQIIGQPRLISMDELPKSLRSLHIFDQSAEEWQLRSIPARLKNLHTLDIQFSGLCFKPDLWMEFITEIIHMRQLNNLFLEEIRSKHENHPNNLLLNSISRINLLSPCECACLPRNLNWVMCGILIAQKMPSSELQSEWSTRVSNYNSKDVEGYFRDAEFMTVDDYHDVLNLFQDENFEQDETEQSLCETSDNEESYEQDINIL